MISPLRRPKPNTNALHHELDVMGARHAGMQGVRVGRKGDPWEPFGPEPDRPVGGLDELADALGA